MKTATKIEETGIATLIRRHRRANGMTQTKLALRLGVTDGAISSWENGGSVPAAEMYPKLAGIFGIPRIDIARAAELTLKT